MEELSNILRMLQRNVPRMLESGHDKDSNAIVSRMLHALPIKVLFRSTLLNV